MHPHPISPDDISERQRTLFWEKVHKTQTCWLWTGAINTGGYGSCRIGRRDLKAHRVAYTLLKGSIPSGLQLDHLCRVRNCVNPDHLEPVTSRVNIHRGVSCIAEHAASTTCPQGHPYDKTYGNHRSCSLCTNAQHKAAHHVDRERKNAAARARYYADHERRLAVMRAKREADREAWNAKNRAWYWARKHA